MPRTCGTMTVHRRLLNESPDYVKARVDIENRALQYARSRTSRTGITRIPVVVHVVYNPRHPEQNIADEQIRSQIDVLNLDFRMQNQDLSAVPEAFRRLAGDARIEFELANII